MNLLLDTHAALHEIAIKYRPGRGDMPISRGDAIGFSAGRATSFCLSSRNMPPPPKPYRPTIRIHSTGSWQHKPK
jgi:hypothetical protein